MAEVEMSISDLLDEMAVKVLMIESDDFSVVGELVVLVEELETRRATSPNFQLHKMVRRLQAAIEKVIMGELPDSAATCNTFGQCIVLM